MKKKVAVVTGGTKGIGAAIVDYFVEQDFTVITCARNIQNTQSKENLYFFEADLSKKEDIELFTNYISTKADTIDVLVNNVGVFIPGSILNEDPNSFELMMNTNLASTYYMTRAVVPMMKNSTKPYIFNICSTASVTAYLNGGSYCISKFAQLGLTKVLRQECIPLGIKVSAVMPGATFTDSWAGTELPKSRFSDAASVATLIGTAYNLPDSTVLEELIFRPLEGDI